MLPATTDRVLANALESVNDDIHERTERRVTHCAASGRQAIDRRLAELDRESDIERAREANACCPSRGLSSARLGPVSVGGLKQLAAIISY